MAENKRMEDVALHPLWNKKVLVIRFSSIGDIVLTSPIVRVLKQEWNVEVHFVTKKKFAAVVSCNPRIDKLYTFDKEITEIVAELKNERFDYVIDLHKNLRSKRLILALGVKSISFNKINVEKWLRVYTRINLLPKKHLVDRYFEGIGALGIEDDGEGLEYFHGLQESEVKELIPDSPYYSIVLGATYFTKRIPTEKLKTVIGYSKLPCVLLGGKDVVSEAALLEKLYPAIINKVGVLDLNESAALVQKSQFVVTGDTGLMHIAAAYKIPTIVFWGSTAHELGMYPFYGKNHSIQSIDIVNHSINCSPCSKIGKDHCPKGHFKCMLDLDDEAIRMAMDSILINF